MNESLEAKFDVNKKEEFISLDLFDREYGLGELDFVGNSDKGLSSHNLIVENQNKKRFFIKQYKVDDAERRKNSNLVERYIAQNSLAPIVLPLETLNGESQIYVDTKMYAVFPFQEHNEVEPKTDIERQKQVFALAETLGRIHSTPMENIDEQVGVIDRWRQRKIIDRIIHLEEIEDTIKNKTSLDQFDQLALDVINGRKEMLSSIEDTQTEEGINTICHGDYHSQNVLFDDDFNIIGVVDWDICGKSDPYIDFLNTFRVTVIGRRYNTYQQDRELEARSFIQGYLSGINFDFNVEQLKKAMTTLTQVTAGSSWPLDDHYFMGHTKADDYLEGEFKKAEFFIENSSGIISFILDQLSEIR